MVEGHIVREDLSPVAGEGFSGGESPPYCREHRIIIAYIHPRASGIRTVLPKKPLGRTSAGQVPPDWFLDKCHPIGFWVFGHPLHITLASHVGAVVALDVPRRGYEKGGGSRGFRDAVISTYHQQ